MKMEWFLKNFGPTRSFRCFASFLLLGLVPLAPSWASDDDPLEVLAATPDSAPSGDLVTIDGSGFGEDPSALFAWVATANGGFPIVPVQASPTELSGLLTRVAVPSTGTLQVFRGQSVHLPDQAIFTQGRLATISGTELLVARQKASGPSFSATTASPNTLTSTLGVDGLEITITPAPLPCIKYGIDVDIIVDGGGNRGSGGTDTSESTIQGLAAEQGTPTPSPAFAATLRISFDGELSTTDQLAAALAELLQTHFGKLGLTATATGSRVMVEASWGIHSGFLSLSWSGGGS